MTVHHQDPDDNDDVAVQHVSMQCVLALFVPYRKRIAAVMLLMVLASATGLARPFLLRAVIDEALPRNNSELLISLVAGMVLVAFLSAAIGAGQVVLSSRIGQTVLHDLRVRLYAHLQSLSLRFFHRNTCGRSSIAHCQRHRRTSIAGDRNRKRAWPVA